MGDLQENRRKRVSAAWQNKRSKAVAHLQPLTKLCPAWLRLKADRGEYEIIEKRADVVRLIFEDSVAGIGSYIITRRLKQKKIVPFGTSRGWQRSYIAKILNNRAVIGEYQPCRIADGRRKPIGDPISSYFPRIVTDELFYRAQQARTERRINGRGRKGSYFTNLFSGIATCAYCGSRIMFDNKGPPPNSGTYLVCRAAKSGLGCVRTGWRYADFESSFLAFVDQLDLPMLIRNSQIKTLQELIQTLEDQLITIDAEMARAYELHQSTSVPIEFASRKFSELQLRQEETKKLLEAKRTERRELQSDKSSFYQSREQIKSLVRKLRARASQGQDLYKLRAQVAAQIKSLVAALEIAPVGQRVPETYDGTLMSLLNHKDSKMVPDQRRYFLAIFKENTALQIFPSKDDPFKINANKVLTRYVTWNAPPVCDLADS